MNLSRSINPKWKMLVTITISLPLLLLLLTPLIFSREIMTGVLSAKFFWVATLSTLLAPVIIVLITIEKIRASSTDIFVFIFLAYLVIQSFFLKVDVHDSKKFMMLFCSAVGYFGVKCFLEIRHPKTEIIIVGLILGTIFLTVIALCVYGILQLFGILNSFNRTYGVTSTFFHPAPFAAFISSLFPMAVYVWFHLFKRRKKNAALQAIEWLALLSVSLTLFILPTLSSRASILALMAGLMYLCIADKRGIRKRMLKIVKKRWLTFIMASALGTTIVIALYQSRKESVDGRWLVWKISSKMIKEHPLFGGGLSSFQQEYPAYQIAYFKSGIATTNEKDLSDEVDVPYNELLQCLIELGVFGTLIFALIISNVLFIQSAEQYISDKFGERAALVIAARSAIVSFLAFSLVSYTFTLAEFVLYFFILLALADGCNNYKGNKIRASPSRAFVVKALIVFPLFIVGVDAPNSYVRWSAYKKWNQAYFSSPIAGKKLFEETSSHLENNRLFQSQYAQNLAALGEYSASIRVLSKKKGKTYDDLMLMGKNFEQLAKEDSALKYYEEASFLLPHKFYPLYHLMDLYRRLDPQKELLIAQKILQMHVKVDSYDVRMIRETAKSVLSKN
jgi:O-antigen ligase